MMRAGVVALVVVAWASTARAQSNPPIAADEADHAIVYELGAVGDWSRAEGLHPGGTVAFEVTPIEHWLELEVGFTAIRATGSTEMPVDLVFKKPWRLSRTVEFMAGVGPEVIHATGRESGTFWGVESVLDVMFWRTRNVGWYVEPGYDVTFRDGTQHQGIDIAGGVIIGR